MSLHQPRPATRLLPQGVGLHRRSSLGCFVRRRNWRVWKKDLPELSDQGHGYSRMSEMQLYGATKREKADTSGVPYLQREWKQWFWVLLALSARMEKWAQHNRVWYVVFVQNMIYLMTIYQNWPVTHLAGISGQWLSPKLRAHVEHCNFISVNICEFSSSLVAVVYQHFVTVIFKRSPTPSLPIFSFV